MFYQQKSYKFSNTTLSWATKETKYFFLQICVSFATRKSKTIGPTEDERYNSQRKRKSNQASLLFHFFAIKYLTILKIQKPTKKPLFWPNLNQLSFIMRCGLICKTIDINNVPMGKIHEFSQQRHWYTIRRAHRDWWIIVT